MHDQPNWYSCDDLRDGLIRRQQFWGNAHRMGLMMAFPRRGKVNKNGKSISDSPKGFKKGL